nr:enoyl-CoA hydratase-related protein [Mesorhizobium sp.]
MSLPTFETVDVEKNGAILTIRLNRPERLNAFNPRMSHELPEAIRAAGRMTDVRAIVLTGAGRAFSAGGDMSEIKDTPGSFAEEAAPARDLVFGLLDCEKPIICRMNGDAIGLGATVALLCDVVVATDTARIADPHVRMGLVAGDGGALIWPQLVGPMVAKYYLLTGDMLPAPEAQAHGLITRSVPAEMLDVEVDKIARKLVVGAPLAVRWTKRAINASLQSMGKLQFDLSLAYEGITLLSRDHAEAKQAFLSKRKPEFDGT